MLVSFRGQWKYPVLYALDAKVDTKELHSLLSKVLELCTIHHFKMRIITVNLSEMKLFGCRLGKSIDDIYGSLKWI